MSIDYVGRYKTKAPKIRHSSKDPFDYCVDGHQDGKKMADYFGFELNEDTPNVWVYVAKHIDPHTDGGGLCLLYLHRGRGTLFILGDGEIYKRTQLAGEVVLFDDCRKHFWLSDTPSTLLCCNVHRNNS